MYLFAILLTVLPSLAISFSFMGYKELSIKRGHINIFLFRVKIYGMNCFKVCVGEENTDRISPVVC